MKQLFVTALALSMSILGSAQLVEVVSFGRVATPDGFLSDVATISPDGSYAVAGMLGSHKLSKVDLKTGQVTTLTENGSPSGVVISPDSRHIVFRTTQFNKNNLRFTGLNSIDLTSGSEKQLIAPSRKLNAGVSVSEQGVTAVENGKIRVKAINGKAKATPVASIDYGHLVVTVNGKSKTIDPQGRGSYLWPAVSPDGSKIVYCLSGAGTFVCNIDGSNPRRIGKIHAAKWLGDNLIVGMNDSDNGETMTASSIMVYDLNGNSQKITEDNQIAIYPSASADGKTIIYANANDGKLYIINLK